MTAFTAIYHALFYHVPGSGARGHNQCNLTRNSFTRHLSSPSLSTYHLHHLGCYHTPISTYLKYAIEKLGYYNTTLGLGYDGHTYTYNSYTIIFTHRQTWYRV